MKRNLYVKPDDHAALLALGDGNMAAGVRVALAMAHTLQKLEPGTARAAKAVALAPVRRTRHD